MIQLFYPDSVTIIRKKGEEFVSEDIGTSPILPNQKETASAVRAATIARLRKDPATVLVLEDKNGQCDEEFEYKDFTFTVSIKGGEKPSARLEIHYRDDLAYDETFDEIENEYGEPILIYSLVNKVIDILQSIDLEDYSFVDEDCPGFERREPEDEVDSMYDIAKMLEESQYQVERLHTIDFASEPCLFVYENELLMIGERHFYGNFFVEMKRIFPGIAPEVVAEAFKEAKKGYYCLECFRYDDGSWGFRTTFSDEVYKSNFEKLLNEAIASLRDVVGKVEAHEDIGSEVFNSLQEQRARFIYEVIDASLKLSKLSI